MPPTTHLAFNRKKQTIDQLSLERPQDLQRFYESVELGLKRIEYRLIRLENSFSGSDKRYEEEVRKYLPSIQTIMRYIKKPVILTKVDVQDLFDSYEQALGDPTMEVKFDMESVRLVQDCVNKIINFLRSGFEEVVDSLSLILNFMKKYCLSFCSVKGDSLLETAINYEKTRREFVLAVSTNLTDISAMADKFESENGIKLSDFGSVARGYAERMEAKYAPYLFMFVQAVQNVKDSIAEVRRWIQEDDSYSTYIQLDIVEKEKERDEVQRTLRDLQVRCSALDHRRKVCKRDISECVSELRRLANKEKSLKSQEECILEELRDIEMDIEVKEIRKEERKKVLQYATKKEREKYDRLISELESLKTKQPGLERKADDIKRKLEFLRFRRELKHKREEQLKEITADYTAADKELRKREKENERLQNAVLKLREIHRYKTSPEVLKKLFYNMPLSHSKNKKGKRKGTLDKLEKACRVVAQSIEKEWVPLYRMLPFHPPRGEENLRVDIDDIITNFMRENQEVQAKQALLRWRRVHTRATLEDLTNTLMYMKRRDIVEKIGEEIAKKKSSQSEKKQSPQRSVRVTKLAVGHPMKLKLASTAAIH
ncbi:unnamed protein product [Mytilus edulis]|uniref:Death domain-containing protein n=1 Tax=Mytilus edulis TaxID=6550 RepID=A0A8S3V690_MYTED|nr:unnamed protein product [Mytilus edulis]